MGMVYLMCGMAAAGKTTFAKKIAAETGAIRYTLDERMIAKYPNVTIMDDEVYGGLVHDERKLIWEEAKEELANGRDVILDWSLWNPTLRQLWIGRVQDAGHDYKLFYLERTIDQLWQRLEKRNGDETAVAHEIPYEELVRFAEFFQPPTAEENLNLQIVPWGE